MWPLNLANGGATLGFDCGSKYNVQCACEAKMPWPRAVPPEGVCGLE